MIKQWILVLALVAGFAQAAVNDAPDQIVRLVSHDVLEIVKKNDKDSSRLRDLVDARVAPLANYNRMTSMAVGRYWRTATPDQQQALIREFRLMLARTYLSALTIYKNAQVEVKGVRAGNSADEQNVRSDVILPGQENIPIDFSFEKTDAGWKVYDISVKGISFINNHRNQFSAIIQKEGVDGLIKQLVERNAAARSSTTASAK